MCLKRGSLLAGNPIELPQLHLLLMAEQPFFAGDTAAVADNFAARIDRAVVGDDDVRVGSCFSGRNFLQRFPNGLYIIW